MNQLPISTQWLLNSTGAINNTIALSVALIYCKNTGSKGTGWLTSDIHVVTNEHVVRGALASDIVVLFPDGNSYTPVAKIDDNITDIAVVTLPSPITLQPLKIKTGDIDIGTKICAWGHPLGYNGPAPILSVGYLAGFSAHQPQNIPTPQRRLVLNAALNPGNSGGPILIWGEDSVCGVAVTKHAPITTYLQSTITALANNKTGVVFTTTDENGNQKRFVESQLVAEILQYFRNMTQVVIGEAIAPSDIVKYLDANSIPWTST